LICKQASVGPSCRTRVYRDNRRSDRTADCRDGVRGSVMEIPKELGNRGFRTEFLPCHIDPKLEEIGRHRGGVGLSGLAVDEAEGNPSGRLATTRAPLIDHQMAAGDRLGALVILAKCHSMKKPVAGSCASPWLKSVRQDAKHSRRDAGAPRPQCVATRS